MQAPPRQNAAGLFSFFISATLDPRPRRFATDTENSLSVETGGRRGVLFFQNPKKEDVMMLFRPDWEDICKKLNLPFRKRSTGILVLLCPFHREKTPSLHMWQTSNHFWCFGCHKGGDMHYFLCYMLNDRRSEDSEFRFLSHEFEEWKAREARENDPSQLLFSFFE